MCVLTCMFARACDSLACTPRSPTMLQTNHTGITCLRPLHTNAMVWHARMHQRIKQHHGHLPRTHMQALLLENTRFHAGDTSNSPDFSKALARLCDVFVNDAFGVSHRDQGSVTVRACCTMHARMHARTCMSPHGSTCTALLSPIVRRACIAIHRYMRKHACRSGPCGMRAWRLCGCTGLPLNSKRHGHLANSMRFAYGRVSAALWRAGRAAAGHHPLRRRGVPGPPHSQGAAEPWPAPVQAQEVRSGLMSHGHMDAMVEE